MRCLAILALALACGPAFAADAPYSYAARGIVADAVDLPACDSPRVLRRIASDFHDKESEYWHSNLRLVGFEPPVEVAVRPWGPEFIARRFCRTRAEVSDGVTREVRYVIGYNTGTLGIADGIESCVVGLDRNLAFSPACKMAGP